MSMTEPLRLGMVGGGPGAMIGPTHRIAAHMYGDWRLVAGAFSRRPERNRAMGGELGLDPGRAARPRPLAGRRRGRRGGGGAVRRGVRGVGPGRGAVGGSVGTRPLEYTPVDAVGPHSSEAYPCPSTPEPNPSKPGKYR